MSGLDLVGTIAGFCTTISFLPQVIKVHRTRHTRDLSLPMYAIFSIGVFFWGWYGVLTHSLPIMAANGLTTVMALYILVMKIRYG